jgi:MerR family transcriptional regulator/heat shock protein HspR
MVPPEAGSSRLDTRALYVISVAAELAGVHPQTLRIYERKGLISPARTSGRSRRYSERDIALLRRIQDLTNAGVSLAGVERILDLEADLAAALRRVRELEAHVDDVVAKSAAMVEEVRRQHRSDIVPWRPPAIVRFESRR